MTLTTHQIDYLFAFTEKKSVRYYDLQVELVDHLAARVEEEMEANKVLTFETALQKVYADFGIFGFSKIVEQKENMVFKQNRKIWFNEILSFVKFPKVAFTVFLFTVLHQLAVIVPFRNVIIITYAAFVLYFAISVIIRYKLSKRPIKKILLLQNHPALFIGIVPILEYSLFFSKNHNPFWFSFAAVLSIVLQYSINNVYKKVQLKATKLYPQAFA